VARASASIWSTATAPPRTRPIAYAAELALTTSSPSPSTIAQERTCQLLDEFVHRHLQIFLDGLRTPARSVLPGRAATFEDLQPKN
ncbi:MAG TPA: TetR/AcrR family transcriptional regulator, partial [Kitasatospora aureofaciens]|nr:TetR/AcrR family transcriptional regulator [Kitasatospora aureofaciens]